MQALGPEGGLYAAQDVSRVRGTGLRRGLSRVSAALPSSGTEWHRGWSDHSQLFFCIPEVQPNMPESRCCCVQMTDSIISQNKSRGLDREQVLALVRRKYFTLHLYCRT